MVMVAVVNAILIALSLLPLLVPIVVEIVGFCRDCDDAYDCSTVHGLADMVVVEALVVVVVLVVVVLVVIVVVNLVVLFVVVIVITVVGTIALRCSMRFVDCLWGGQSILNRTVRIKHHAHEPSTA